jgi:Uma2 family endonuclease
MGSATVSGAAAGTMSRVAVAQRLDASAYLAQRDPDRWTELVEGEVVEHVNAPRLVHQRIVANLLDALRAWTRGPGHGEAVGHVDVQLDQANVYAPDVLWFADPTGLDPQAAAQSLPDLAVEVRSPGTWRYDVGTKKRVYERTGLRELWLVDDQAPAVLVFRRATPSSPVFDVEHEAGPGDVLTSPLLPGLRLPVDDLFTG